MAALAREWGQSGTGHGSLHFCTCASPPKHGTRDTGTRVTMPPYSSFVLFLLSSSLPLHYLVSLKLPLSSRPNLNKQHGTSQRWLYNKRGRATGLPPLWLCGEPACGQEWEWKELRVWSQKTCIRVSHLPVAVPPGKIPRTNFSKPCSFIYKLEIMMPLSR